MDTLPSSVDYSEPMGVIPAGTENYNVTCYAVNGSSFTAGQQIIVDLNNVGYLDPASLSIRYKLALGMPAVVAAAAIAGTSMSVPGCPVYTPLLRLDTLFNSNVVESINNYNSVATALSNLEMSVSDKMGQQSALGYISQAWKAATTVVPVPYIDYSTTNELTDGLNLNVGVTTNAIGAATTATFALSAPLPCLLSNPEKLVPLNGTNIRLQFTLDSQTNVCPTSITPISTSLYGGLSLTGVTCIDAATGNALGMLPTAGAFNLYTITNFEVVYNQIQFPPHVEKQILAMPKLRIKTSSYATGLQTLAAGVGGTVNLVYNLRYASIKALFLLMGASATGTGNAANYPNKLFESVDITSGNGSFNFQCNGVYYPQNPLSTANSKGGVLTELRRAMIDLYANNSNSMAINSTEFSKTDASIGAADSPVNQSCSKVGKFYVGVNTQKMSDKAVFSGISSQNSPITAIINIGSTATIYGYSPILMCYYDSIIEIDVQTKQVNYIF